jgi:hypothetical protein
MTEKEKQQYDKKLLAKEVKKFMKKLKDLEPQLKAVYVTDVKLCIAEKKTIINIEDIEKAKLITDERSFKDKIMSI